MVLGKTHVSLSLYVIYCICVSVHVCVFRIHSNTLTTVNTNQPTYNQTIKRGRGGEKKKNTQSPPRKLRSQIREIIDEIDGEIDEQADDGQREQMRGESASHDHDEKEEEQKTKEKGE